ncbi:hypothetical protein [Pyxidicoccus parkwayensis]|nr:hypothetical protein [Pyxidicoccus parkwaysis]
MFSSRLPAALALSAALSFAAACSKNATTSQQYPPGTQPVSTPTQPQEQTGQPPARAEIEKDCPMTVPGAQAMAQDTAEGVAINFITTEPDQVANLRDRGRNMIQRQQEHGVSGKRGLEQPPGVEYKGMGGGGLAGSAGAPSVPAYARVEDIPNGVSITYRATDPEKQAELSAEVHENAESLKPGLCPGMAHPVEE